MVSAQRLSVSGLMLYLDKGGLTGVRSSSISSVADAAASIKSSHRFPKLADGSADCAFLSEKSSSRIRRNQSAAVPRDLCFLWPLLLIDCFLGRPVPVGRCSGGRVEERPGGELERMDGSRSRRLRPFRPEYGSLVGSCIGGSSIVERGILGPSASECQPWYRC